MYQQQVVASLVGPQGDILCQQERVLSLLFGDFEAVTPFLNLVLLQKDFVLVIAMFLGFALSMYTTQDTVASF